MPEDVLAKTRGDELRAAVLTLHDVTTHAADTVTAVLDATGIGPVRVVFPKFRSRHHRRWSDTYPAPTEPSGRRASVLWDPS